MRDIKIAVCDDEAVDLAQIQQMIQQYDPQGELRISTFLRAADLLDGERISKYDIVILDIEMEAPTGFEVAQNLVKLSNSPIIIFVTKSSAYTLRGYGIALRYLQKPLLPELFFEAMDAALADVRANRVCFLGDDTTIAIPFREIRYIEMFGHYAVIHTEYKEFRVRSTLKDINAILPHGYFAVPHKSIIVSFNHIRSATSSEVILDNGERIPISRRRQQEFNMAFCQFLGR